MNNEILIRSAEPPPRTNKPFNERKNNIREYSNTDIFRGINFFSKAIAKKRKRNMLTKAKIVSRT